jgi:putative transposase
MPRMNAIMERWAATGRRELLDRMVIWNQAALREFETHYNLHRPHRLLDQSATLRPAPKPSPTAPPSST